MPMGQHGQRKQRTAQRSNTTDSDEQRAASPGSFMQLQRTLGNRAMQRMLKHEPAHAKSAAEPAESPPKTLLVAKLTDWSGKKYPGSSKVPGHKGEIDLEYYNLTMTANTDTAAPNEPLQTRLWLTKRNDGSSGMFLRAMTERDIVKGEIAVLSHNEHGNVKTEFIQPVHDATVEQMIAGIGAGGEQLETIKLRLSTEPEKNQLRRGRSG